MYSQSVVVAIFGIILSVVNSGLALQCWKCSSDFDITCRDHFNVTRIQQNRRYFEQINYSGRQQAAGNNPQLIHCDEMYTSSNYDTINVCMKREHTTPDGKKVVNRECQLVSRSLKAGQCPPEIYQRFPDIDFCQTCNYDGCNSATGLKTNLMAACVPLALLLFLRK
ncbi:uncharacterized protein LOC109600096 [Aethina tumida]|uniref:uncharacterized protein LOC109600096 n=1 Tax=Aethina tumida TaxID=116153 RepID=UPI00096B4B0E|nr:uncharacterized protein LOC109600096 [Aethina tumida]